MKIIQGTEHEYTMFCTKLHSMGMDPHSIALELLRKSELHACGEFMQNQSRAYYDVGHLEVSTCETSNFFDLAIWEKAGEKIVDWLRKKTEELYCGDYKIRAYKNNTSPDGTSYGSHENYLVNRNVNFPERFVRELMPHLVSRMIYTGAGDIIDGKYVLSPSAYLTGTLVSDDTMHNTGILNTRDEPLGSQIYRRLHLQIGDALMNESSIMLRNFSTSHILRLMEEDRLSDAPELSIPVEDLWRNVEETNPDKWAIHLKNGKKISPMEVQEYYLAKIETLVSDDKQKKIFKLLERVLSDLKNKNSKRAARNVEWLDRYFAIQEEMDKAPEDPQIQMKACKRYSEIGEDRGIFYRRQRIGLVDKILDDSAILKAVHEPPEDTRAHARKFICDEYDVEYLDWDYAIFSDGKTRKRYNLEDPYSYNVDKLKGV